MTDAKRAATEVVLGVETRISMSTLWWPWIILAEKPGRVKCAHDGEGLREPSVWAEGFGTLRCAGVERTSSYGAGIARHLKTAEIPVTELERPRRRHLHGNSNSDSRDAERAARAVLAGETAGEPNSAHGRMEMIRALRTARRSAVNSRTQAANQLRAYG